MKFRTITRKCLYKSDWSLNSVLAECEQSGIPASIVTRTICRLYAWSKVPVERLGGALAIILLKTDKRICSLEK